MKFEIKSRFSTKVLFELECASLKLCVEKAVSTGAYLRGADLRGADGEKIKLIKTPIWISNLKFEIIILDSHMKIGCQFHSLSNWWSFDDDEIAEMDSDALTLTLWKANKSWLKDLCEANGRA